jgi:predicted alpha/beta superfamily hydrolase
MNRSVAFWLMLWLCLLAAPGRAQQQLTQFALNSQVLGEERRVLVYTPRSYEQGEQRYPVLYMTDGEAQLGHTVATVEFLARNGRMPELIIVAITNTDRTRDLTPTKGTLRGASGRPVEFPTSGGADKFLTFIEKELMPQIEGKYRTHPYRIFAGHSFGGLLALHTFTSHPDLFNAILAVSPSFDWDQHFVSKRAEEFLKGRKELNRTLFFTLANEGGETRVGYDRFKALLNKQTPKGLSWNAMLMEDEDHGSVVLRSHYHGLRKIFEGWQIPPDPTIGAATGTWATIEEHYRKLSARFGFRIPPPEALVNQAGYQLLGNGWTGEAIKVLQANVTNYPHSANVYDSLGEAYEKSGKLELAKPNYEKAVQYGERSNDPNLNLFRENLQRVTALLQKTKAVGQK